MSAIEIKYEFKHPNNGWQSIFAPCDARSFALLMDWPIRTGPISADPEFNFFNLIWYRDDHTLLEVVSDVENGWWGNKYGELLYCVRPGTKEPESYLQTDLRSFDCQIVRVCESSDPVGMAMPLKIQGGDLWMLPIPEEVFGLKGAYIRLIIPQELVR